MSATIQTVEVAVDCELRVPRGRAGDLDDGVREVFEKIDGVRAVEVRGIDGMRPDAFDLYVDATARLDVETDATADRDELAALVRDGFGVVDVDRLEVAQ